MSVLLPLGSNLPVVQRWSWPPQMPPKYMYVLPSVSVNTAGSIEKLPAIGLGSALNGPVGLLEVATPIRKRPRPLLSRVLSRTGK